MNYSGFWKRVGAVLIDAVIVFIPGIIVGMILPYIGGVICYLIYKPVFESSPLMATPGKAFMGIKVCDLNGGRITFQAALIRSLMTYVSSVILLIGYVMMFFSTKNQCLHDYVANTVVIIENQTLNKSYLDIWMDEIKSLLNCWGFIGPQQNQEDRSYSAQTNQSTSTVNTSFSDSEIAKKLKELQSLKEQGLITEADYETHKNEILKKI